MNFKPLVRRLILSTIVLVVLVSILFFIFIVPYRTLPILMYHSIQSAERKDDNLTLAKYIFKRQMKFLSRNNYRVASLREVIKMIKKGKNIPKDWVVITFDDGYRDFYNQAYPILREHKFNATVFVTIDYLWNNKNCLSWDQVEQLAKDDLIDIGSHSLYHSKLVLLSVSQAEKEILLSKLILEKRLKKTIMFFSYPFGATNDSIKGLVKKAGFEAAVGTAYQRGEFRNDDIYILRRIFVSRVSQYPFVFKFMLSGYYVPTRELFLRVLNIKTPRDIYIVTNR